MQLEVWTFRVVISTSLAVTLFVPNFKLISRMECHRIEFAQKFGWDNID